MGFFKTHSIICDLPIDKAQAVAEKITGEFGKFVRESYDRYPFTGTVKEGKFSMMPNVQGNAIKLKGTIQSENMNQVRIDVEGHFMAMKFILFLFISIPILIMAGMLVSTMIIVDHQWIGLLAIFFPLLFIAHLFFRILGQPKSDYDEHVYELMRKMDRHELVL
ncbi:MAG: hypothetical protein ACI857_002435 [Arenicella sp.]|jgi:hypothetical protein